MAKRYHAPWRRAFRQFKRDAVSVVGGMALIAAISSTAIAEGSERVILASGKDDGISITGYVYRPLGTGPFPAVVALHGCSGLFSGDGDSLNARHRDWAERLTAHGYVVLFPDSYTARGFRSICNEKQRGINPKGRVADVQAGADWLAAQPFVDPAHLALIGWSNGGSTVLQAMASEARPHTTDFRIAFAFYPGCRALLNRAWLPRIPLSILIGAADDWTPSEPCAELSRRWNADFKLYPGAYHDFDAPNLPVRVKTGVAFSSDGSGRVHTGTDEAARQEAIAYVMGSLENAFK